MLWSKIPLAPYIFFCYKKEALSFRTIMDQIRYDTPDSLSLKDRILYAC